MIELAPSETYYDLPVVKAAPWRWYVPAYFHLGGMGGAAATLLPFAQLRGDLVLAKRLHWIAAISEAAGGVMLIADLGKPLKFVNMMRVFRPTSPMNMGTWILSAATGAGGLALLGSLRGNERLSISSAGAAIAGSMLSTYTGVLLGNTATPVWKDTRRVLPLWFAAQSAASLASLLEYAGPRPPPGYAPIAKAAALAGQIAVERAASARGVAAPLRSGRTGQLWKGAKWLGAASLVASVLRRPRLAGVLGTASAVLARFAIVDAGRASAADPRATLEPQRSRAGAHVSATP